MSLSAAVLIYCTRRQRQNSQQAIYSKDVVDEGGRLTDDEDTHDDDEHNGHVLLVPALGVKTRPAGTSF